MIVSAREVGVAGALNDWEQNPDEVRVLRRRAAQDSVRGVVVLLEGQILRPNLGVVCDILCPRGPLAQRRACGLPNEAA
jgi:hypothetical protein